MYMPVAYPAASGLVVLWHSSRHLLILFPVLGRDDWLSKAALTAMHLWG